MAIGRALLAERLVEARKRSMQIRSRTERALPKGHPDRYLHVITPDGSFEGRLPRPVGNPVPEQVRMRRLAANKSMARAGDALAAFDGQRAKWEYEVIESTMTPYAG